MDSTVDSMDYLGKCVYHLTHNLSKKILTVETPEDIYWEISHSFNIQHFTIQYYVKDFDDWVDFNSNITSGKLKIISTKPETHDEDMPSTSAKSDSESDTVEIIDSSDLDHSETLSLSDETSTPETNKKWPTIYKMPNLPNIIKQELTAVEQGSLPYVGDKIRRSIVTVLFEDMSQFTRYPMPNQYREVCQTLIREYPVLADRFSTTGCYFTTWLKKLRTRFKDSHRSLAENDYVMEMRKKYGHPTKRKADSTENKEIKRMKTSQTTDVEVFEDDDSIKIHIAAIKKEVNKSNLDEELIKDRLERTKQWRRNFIVRSTLNEVLQTFPILRISKWLLHEMKCLTGIDVQNQLICVPWNKVPASYESIADLHDSAWILLVPLVFKEKLHHFFLVDKEVTSPYPVIKVDKIKKIIEIHVDGSYISTCIVSYDQLPLELSVCRQDKEFMNIFRSIEHHDFQYVLDRYCTNVKLSAFAGRLVIGSWEDFKVEARPNELLETFFVFQGGRK